MAFIHSPKIVTAGLVLALDAANTKSYVSGSTNWFSLTNPTTSGSLINGPVFNTGSGGSIVFDGVNDYVRIDHSGDLDFNSSDFTTSNWCRVDGGSGSYRALFQSSVGATSTRQFGVVGSTNNKWGVWMTINNVFANRLFSNASIVIGEWVMVTAVYRNNNSVRLYLNNYEDSNASISGNLSYNPTIMLLGARFSAEYFNGVIATGQIYNRALSAAEVQQNYNATKGRFGL
jgi:hypothetical protein